MKKEELHIEEYAEGYIVSWYGDNNQYAYFGKNSRRMQPIISDWFETKELAEKKIEELGI